MRLLLLEDDDILGEALKDYLQSEAHVVDWFVRLVDAQTALREPYDALVIDWRLPDGSGVQWLRQLRRDGIATPAIVITARDLLSDRIEGLDSGADDYIVKPFDPAELAARLRALRRRMVTQGQLCKRFGAVKIDTTSATVYRDGAVVTLTAREWALLEALVARAGRIVSKRDLESLLTGLDNDINSNAVEVHVFKLRRKLGSTVIETVRGRGYRMAP